MINKELTLLHGHSFWILFEHENIWFYGGYQMEDAILIHHLLSLAKFSQFLRLLTLLSI